MPFRRDRLVVVAPADHALAARDVTDFRRCLAYDFVGLNRGSSLLDTLARAAQDAGLPLRLRIQVRSFDAMCEMIAAGLGIGVLPLGACERRLGPWGLTALRLESWAERQLLIAASAERPLSASAALLLRHLRDGADA